MYIDKILCPITTLGPGKRLVIWTRGCSKNCKGCISPEMADIGSCKNYTAEFIFNIVKNIYDSEGFEGITISGGDPFEQLEELLLLVEKCRSLVDDILVYTGFVWESFRETIDESTCRKIRSSISVLIDGPYIQEQNYPHLTLRGSENQKILFFDDSLKDKYEKYMEAGRKLQNIYLDNKLITVGIMNR